MKHFDIDGDGLINFHEYLLIVTLLSIPLKVCGTVKHVQQPHCKADQLPSWHSTHCISLKSGIAPAGRRDSICNVGCG